ncbi:hypothetical protein PWG71_17390 [Nocardiopsis sp. N85]|uniref:hypothetical protein n=1 Tax=Nocardiopsis sp. N85 TaxID=3029400 RepID=UPI00237F9A20|nr:hypothetical protein [Nocardiopsis sp. N85]MDE3723169.1 hypothetical protein [Nocardiopsis sp. N85]
MGLLGAGDVITLLVAVMAVAVCYRVGPESVRRALGHRSGPPTERIDADERRKVYEIRHGLLERRYALLDTAGARVRESTGLGGAGAGERGDPVRLVADLDRDLAGLDAEEERLLARTRADFTERRARAERARSTAWWLDVVCAGAAVLLAGVAVGAAVAAVL